MWQVISAQGAPPTSTMPGEPLPSTTMSRASAGPQTRRLTSHPRAELQAVRADQRVLTLAPRPRGDRPAPDPDPLTRIVPPPPISAPTLMRPPVRWALTA